MPHYDLDAILDRIDLESLADQLCGPRRGHGSGARWPSPVADHPQTGRTPPMSIFTDRRGRQRWTCWSTGTSGTAIDLVATARRIDVADSIQWLAERVGTAIEEPPPRRPPSPPRATEPGEDLHQYVADCVRELHKPSGTRARQWLAGRRLDPDILKLNEVGYDPGRRLRRARGLPWRGEGVVLPTFDQAGNLKYAQTRYLDPGATGRKYDNPASRHASKPRLSWPRIENPTGSDLFVCEGVIDALTIAGFQRPSVALICAGDARSAAELANHPGRLILMTDPDQSGNCAAQHIRQQLSGSERPGVLTVNLPADVNDLAVQNPDALGQLLADRTPSAPRRSAPYSCR